MEYLMKRSNNGVIRRQVPRDKTGKDLFGKTFTEKKRCNVCKEYKVLSEFYVQNNRDTKHMNDTRNCCIECWDVGVEFNRLKKKGLIPYDGNTLEDFIDE